MQTIYNDNGIIQEQFNLQNGKLNCSYLKYNENGQLIIKSLFKDGKLNGISKAYDNQGKLIQKSHYKAGLLEGRILNYNNEKLMMISHYHHGQKEGDAYFINENRQIYHKQVYQNGKLQYEFVCYLGE